MFRLSAAAAAVCLAALAAGAADDNPYKAAKKGDFAVYKVKVNFGGLALDGTTRQEVVEVTDKEATVKVTGNVGGTEIPAQEQKIDLTKPFDPTQVGALPPGVAAKVEKGKDGKEELKIGEKKYDTTWTSYKVKANAMGMDIEAEVKVWMAKGVPMGMIKMESTASIAKQEMKMSMELAETGNAKKN
ncbi:MAG: hypothetical protein C0501_06025 [Isosphaera sp.]|nr:hypothetical protein [Isosphaera sp.]